MSGSTPRPRRRRGPGTSGFTSIASLGEDAESSSGSGGVSICASRRARRAPPEKPELVLKTAESSVDECVAQTLSYLEKRGILSN